MVIMVEIPSERRAKTKLEVEVDLGDKVKTTPNGRSLTGRVNLIFQEEWLKRSTGWTHGYQAMLITPEGNIYELEWDLDQASREDVSKRRFDEYVNKLSSGKGFVTLSENRSVGHYHEGRTDHEMRKKQEL